MLRSANSPNNAFCRFTSPTTIPRMATVRIMTISADRMKPDSSRDKSRNRVNIGKTFLEQDHPIRNPEARHRILGGMRFRENSGDRTGEVVRHSTPADGKVGVKTIPPAGGTSRATSSVRSIESIRSGATHRICLRLDVCNGLSGHRRHSFTGLASWSLEPGRI